MKKKIEMPHTNPTFALSLLVVCAGHPQPPICNERLAVCLLCVSLSREIIQYKDSHYGITLYGTVYRLFEHPIEVYGLILSEN